MPFDPSSARRWLNDILYHIDLAQSFAADVDEEAFSGDALRLYAVTRCLEIISEASRRLPDEMKARHPSIAWSEMAAAGNVFRHEYEVVAARRVWTTLRLALPNLRAVVVQEFGQLSGDEVG